VRKTTLDVEVLGMVSAHRDTRYTRLCAVSILLVGCGTSSESASPSSAGSPHDAASTQDVSAERGDGASAGCTLEDVSAGLHTYSCAGLTYDVNIPAACVSSSCGLVVDVHGLSMSGIMEDNNTNLRQLGEQYGYIVVQPNAIPAPPLSSWTPSTDDPKVFGFIELAVSTLHVDTKRVHMTGFSEGGYMTYRFLCDHANYFASVAPAAGAGCSFGGDAGMWGSGGVPSREIPVLAVNGTLDALVSFDKVAVPQRDTVIAGWHMDVDAGVVVAGDSTFTRTRYSSPSGNIYEFIQHNYSSVQALTKGHCFPGSKDLDGGEPGQVFGFACQPPNSFVWGDEVMKFFVAHPGAN
jgi:poly(3-hydroxybutyrate) depolymerase